jgi:superfamily II DNA or RNA helicase
MQLHTGGGKTRIFSAMTAAARKNKKVVWIVVPRNELLRQSSETLSFVGVPHGSISAKSEESLAFDVHVVSKDTLIRRLDKIRREPDFIIIDECHIALDRYIEIVGKFPKAKILGVTATPSRLDGRGLSELYETLVSGPEIAELVSMGYLTPVDYYRPQIDGIEDIRRIGTEAHAGDLEALLDSRKIYGDIVSHYGDLAGGKSCLVFCRNIKMADTAAQKFCDAGFKFENIDGTMTYRRRKGLIDALSSGELHGLTSCELITYGLDVPRVECVSMLRPTMSRTLFCQMIGRGLRPWEGKQALTVLDHVGNYNEHGHPLAPHDWDFKGTEKAKRKKKDPELVARLCMQNKGMYCDKPSCIGCEHNTKKVKSRAWDIIETELQQVDAPTIKIDDRPLEQRKEIQDRIAKIIDEYSEKPTEIQISSGAVGDALKLAEMLGKQPLWVYYLLNKNKHLINRTLLHEIARQKKYKPGWVWNKTEEMKRRTG